MKRLLCKVSMDADVKHENLGLSSRILMHALIVHIEQSNKETIALKFAIIDWPSTYFRLYKSRHLGWEILDLYYEKCKCSCLTTLAIFIAAA